MVDWRWISKVEVLTLHERQLEVHGGVPGLRDEGLLESAVAKPRNLFAYGEPLLISRHPTHSGLQEITVRRRQ